MNSEALRIQIFPKVQPKQCSDVQMFRCSEPAELENHHNGGICAHL